MQRCVRLLRRERRIPAERSPAPVGGMQREQGPQRRRELLHARGAASCTKRILGALKTA